MKKKEPKKVPFFLEIVYIERNEFKMEKEIMHELSVATRILHIAQQQLELQGLKTIHTISMRVGVMQGYEPKWMQHYFEKIAKGTPAEGARLVVELVPIMFRCRSCGHEFAFDAHGTDDCSCPQCHSFSYDMISGNEFEITQMEVSNDADE